MGFVEDLGGTVTKEVGCLNGTDAPQYDEDRIACGPLSHISRTIGTRGGSLGSEHILCLYPKGPKGVLGIVYTPCCRPRRRVHPIESSLPDSRPPSEQITFEGRPES